MAGRLHQFLSVSQAISFPSGASGLQRECPKAVWIVVNEVKAVRQRQTLVLIPQGTLCVVIKLSAHGKRCVSHVKLIRPKRLFFFFFWKHVSKGGPVLYNSCPNLLGTWQIALCCCGAEEEEAFKNKMICTITVKRKSKPSLIFGPKKKNPV